MADHIIEHHVKAEDPTEVVKTKFNFPPLLRMMQQYDELQRPESLAEESGSTMLHQEAIEDFFKNWHVQAVKRALYAVADDDVDAMASAKNEIDTLKTLEGAFADYLTSERNPVERLMQLMDGYPYSPKTRANYKRLALQYMRYHDWEPQFSREEIMAYVAYLHRRVEAKTLSAASVEIHKFALKLWCEALGVKWPYSDTKKPKGKSTNARKRPPTLRAEQVEQFIHLLLDPPKKRNGPIPEQDLAKYRFYGCLATIYAPRASELKAITKESFQWNHDGSGWLTIPTLKGGEIRELRVEPYLAPFLRDYDPIPNTDMVWLWDKMVTDIRFKAPQEWEKKANPEYAKWKRRKRSCKNGEEVRQFLIENPKPHHNRRNAISWHAFRHSLVTELLDRELNELKIEQWMGWSITNSGGMGRRYYVKNKGTPNLNEYIFKHHPFAEYWKL